MTWTRRATAEEADLLLAGGWANCNTDDDPCWHHPAQDMGNEPFTSDQALELARCTHPGSYQGTTERDVFCVGCHGDWEVLMNGEEAA